MAIGDLDVQIFNTAASYVSFVPSGSNRFMIMSLGAENEGVLHIYDGAQTTIYLYKSDYSTLNGYQPTDCKIIIKNSVYARLYGDLPTSISMAQVA